LYGSDTGTATPNLRRLAERGVTFDMNFSGSMPCMPARRDLWTDQLEFPWRPWGSLEPWDNPLPRVLRDAGYVTQLITDHYHLFEPGGENYHCHFNGYELIRGHENDAWLTDPDLGRDIESHPAGHILDSYKKHMDTMHREEDFCSPRTFASAANWLDRNHTHENFFLMIDEFDPHEPFHVPEPYNSMYEDEPWDDKPYFWEPYGLRRDTDRQMRHLRAQYQGKVTMTDAWFGRLLDVMDRHDLWDNTAVIVMTDHGHFLGEKNIYGKPPCAPYDQMSHTPMIMWMPGMTARPGSRCSALTQTVDLYATILEMAGHQPPRPVHGRSIVPLLTGRASSIRDSVLYGYYGRWFGCSDGIHTYLRGSARPENDPLYIYSQRYSTAPWWTLPPLTDYVDVGPFMPMTDHPVFKVPCTNHTLRNPELAKLSGRDGEFDITESFLYDAVNDPEQERNLAGTAAERHAKEVLVDSMRALQVPEEQYERLGLT
ncbi:MAG: sulfatase, partial [Planctomycetota bacterium]